MVGRLVDRQDKNKAYSLLYDRYIGKTRKPWVIPEDNPSGLRIEERITQTNGIFSSQKVLVDKFEHTSILGGIQCPQTGALLSTARILRRCDQPDSRLEVEHYPSLPDSLREPILSCDVEGNRMANALGFGKKKSIVTLYHALMKEAKGEKLVYSAPPAFVGKMPLADNFVLGSFKYDDADEYAVSVGTAGTLGVALLARAYAASGLSFYLLGGEVVPLPLALDLEEEAASSVEGVQKTK